MNDDRTCNDGLSRRSVLKTGIVTTGVIAGPSGLVAASHPSAGGQQGGQALIREGHYIPGEPFTLRFETDFDKPRSCQSGSSPDVNWACYTMKYVESGIQETGIEGFDFEVRPEADHVDGPEDTFGDTEYVLGDQSQECQADFPGDWLATTFRSV